MAKRKKTAAIRTVGQDKHVRAFADLVEHKHRIPGTHCSSKKLDELDQLRFQACDEKRARLQAQKALLEAQHLATLANLETCDEEWLSLQGAARRKYGLGERDAVDIASGNISRAPALKSVKAS